MLDKSPFLLLQNRDSKLWIKVTQKALFRASWGSDPSAQRPTLGGDSLPLSRERHPSLCSLTMLMLFEHFLNSIKFNN